MRTIKFRGQIEHTNEWVQGYYFETPLTDGKTDSMPEDGWSFLTGKNRHVISRNSCVYQVNPETVGQFTGLTDKNGVEIYEGDILSVKEFWNNGMSDFTYEDRDLFELNDLKGELHDKYITDIAYEPGCFVIKTGKEDYDCFASVFEGNQKHSQPIFDFEVIGNIHDNPELLQ